MTSPFRDELETLQRENERLRAELARSHGPLLAPWPALVLVAVDVGAAMLLRPWLNAGSDLRFWTAMGVLGAITLAAGAAAVGYKRRAG